MKSLVLLAGLFFVLNYAEAKRLTVGGCVVPNPPMFGSFEVDHYKRQIQYSCDDGFILIPRRYTRVCVVKKRGGVRYYDWSGKDPFCYSLEYSKKLCPVVSNPQNGRVVVTSYEKDGIASFFCNKGHVLVGPQRIKCLRGHRWNRDYPICQATGTVQDFANILKGKFVDKYAASTATKDGGLQAKLSVGKAGLDLVFAIDTSASIGPESLKKAKAFVKRICNIFNVTEHANGGKNGTRIALVTFSENAKVEFNLNDPKVRSLEKVFERLDEVKNSGGGTNFLKLMSIIKSKIVLKAYGKQAIKNDKTARERRDEANRAIFIITDAEQTFSEKGKDSKQVTKLRLKRIARNIRKNDKFEVFAIGVGTQIQRSFLTEIASPPYHEHVFEISNFESLKTIGDIIGELNIDYGKCGISGNTESFQNGDSHGGAWPWLGWVSVHQSSGSMISCGGAVLCDRWFMTLASCVTERDGNETVTLENRINVFLGDHNIEKRDQSEKMAVVSNVHVHPDFTGKSNEHGVIPYDIALLELGYDNSTIPKLNKYIRPLCFPEKRDKATYDSVVSMLSTFKTEKKMKAQIAGWGHMGGQKTFRTKSYPWPNLRQLDQNLQADKVCQRRYPGIDRDMFICVGVVDKPQVEICHGDVGGPLMASMYNKRYTMLGLAQKTEGCQTLYQFSIFLNVLHPSISKWVQGTLRGCNRIDETIPYVEEEIEEPVGDKNETESQEQDGDVDGPEKEIGNEENDEDPIAEDDNNNVDGNDNNANPNENPNADGDNANAADDNNNANSNEVDNVGDDNDNVPGDNNDVDPNEDGKFDDDNNNPPGDDQEGFQENKHDVIDLWGADWDDDEEEEEDFERE